MNQLLEKITDSAAGIVAAGIVGVIWLNLKWLWNSKRSMEKILSEILPMRSNIAILIRTQGPVLLSLKASLEAQRDGHCNGNVEKALKKIEEYSAEFDEHLLSMVASTKQDEDKR